MVVWTTSAISDLEHLILNTKSNYKNTIKKYIRNLINYIEILNTMPYLGKRIYYKNSNLEIRQLLYKKHRIIYEIKNNQCCILAIIHIKQNFKKIIICIYL